MSLRPAGLRAAVLVAVWVFAGGCSQQADESAAVPRTPDTAEPIPAGVLRMGSVSVQMAREHAIYLPFVEWVASRLHDVGIGVGKVVVEDSLGAMADRIVAGEVDIYIDSPFPVAWMARQTGVRPLLRRWKQGVPTYSSVVFARSDSGIERVADLRGRVIAFGEPFSTTSFLLPKAQLASAGYELERYEDPAAAVPPDRVGYLFSMDAENTMAWVLHGRIAAGAVNSDYFDEMAAGRRDELRVLLRSDEVPRHVLCYRSGLPIEVVRRLESVLLEMHNDEDGRARLDDFEGTDRFDRFPIDPEQALQPVDALLEYVATDVGR